MRKMGNLKVLECAFHIAERTYCATRAFPAEEKYGLVSQMRRAAVSIGSNVAEGCGRSTERQLHNFLQIAAGSASELQFQAHLAVRLGIGDPIALAKLVDLIAQERKMLGALCARIADRSKSEARSAGVR